MINKLITTLPEFVDLTNTAHLELINETVDELLSEFDNQKKLDEIENKLIAKNDKSIIFILQAIKIAKSKILINQITEPVRVSVVFAVYKENNRIRKSSEHPHGEDFLLRKVAQLEDLFGNHPNFKWELIVVDDGCPEHSGQIAQNIVDENQLNKKVKVLFLEKAIEQHLPIVNTLSSTSDSQKGGAIAYGMWDAIQHSSDKNHIVIFTDADLSTHLGQSGLLIHPLITQNKSVAIGSRREETSVVVKAGTRNDRGKLFIYLWKRLIPNLGEIIDTQCGFKAFRKEMLAEIIDDLIEKKFAFDIELLLKAELIKQHSIIKVPIAWIDSEAASTTTDIQPYLPMLKSIVKMYRKYFSPNPTSDEFAAFIESLDEEEFSQILSSIPSAITNREPFEFHEFEGVTVSDLK
ncbi:MAG: hypothetical protein DRJ05_12080 [Bacteroidetes bacterium]|nr:MAG: hypothetical protein DRJ05_12080 [Bacteroidota bacterium]